MKSLAWLSVLCCLKSLAWPPAPVCFLLRYRSQKHPRTDGLSRCWWYACTFGVCDHFGGVKQQERMTDMAVGPTRALQLAAVSGDRAGMA